MLTPGTGRAARSFPVVGLGASAGGLDAFQRFFDAMPADSGMAFVLIQHLDPTHASMMRDLLAGHTQMRVVEATDGMPLEPDHVYLIPPGAYLALQNGALRLTKPRDRHGTRLPFDFFLRSLANESGERAICAILSGTGSDGSLGLKSVNEQSGLVIVQDPHEAAHDGMPRSAIDTGCADLVLPVAKIPEAIIRFCGQAHVKNSRKDPSRHQATDGLTEIIALLSATTSHDFSLYKYGTLQRRVERRMAMAGIEHSERYLEVLREDAKEREILAKDLLINVTHFFRDPPAFDLLAEKIVPELVREQPLGQPLRVWVPGCSTGEETYSIAMLFLEEIAATKRNIKLQVFASDIDPDCVAFARNGAYPEQIQADVTTDRLARFFLKEDGTYRVIRELREAVVFTTQNLLADAPFSRIDFISCRNLLIYLSSEAQEQILSLFHFALRGNGVLFLGSSETVGNLGDRFAPISKKHRIFRHIGRSRPGEVSFPVTASDYGRTSLPEAARKRATHQQPFGALAEQSLLAAYAPASVLINAHREGLHFFGGTDRYLKVPTGEASQDILVMAREGLRSKLRAAIQRASDDQVRTLVTGARVERNGSPIDVNITVLPVHAEGDGYLLVSFTDEAKREPRHTGQGESAADASRIAELEQELESMRVELKSAIHELEIANEEHKAINEEAMSVNEEFQSTNEELETSKEELQSLNEELNALNSQLQETVERQRATSDDLNNILNSSDVATLFLDCALKIRFFTPATKALFNVIATDIGRPLGDLTHRFADDDLLAEARTVLETLAPLRREVEADNGTWYIRRILPYRSDAMRVEGVVVTFAGISEIKAAQQEIQAARAYSDSIIATISEPLVVLDEELRVISASSAFYRVFSVEPRSAVGQQLHEAGRHLDVPALREFIDSLPVEGALTKNAEIAITLPTLGRRVLVISARVMQEQGPAKRKFLVAIVDVTEAKRVGEVLAAAKAQAERANIGKSRFLAAASHDLRQPLQTISLLQGILAKRVTDVSTRKLVDRLDETVSSMSSMLDKLLDINQLEAGIVRPEVIDFPINGLLDQLRTEFTYHAAEKGLRWSVVPSRLAVRSDPQLLEQMLRNLLSNAVKYTKEGKILLGCRRRGEKLRIEVLDTGIGIPTMEVRRIFEEFHQLDNPARESSRGLGLGLSIVQRLGELLGHPIDVRSLPGSGSVFAVEVPLGDHSAVSAPSTQEHEKDDEAALCGAILVIEDDPAVRETIKLLLDGEGHRTSVAVDGASALELAAQEATRPDLVIADYNLPRDVNGLNIIASLQTQLHHPIPAIVLTGDISTDTLREIARHGCIHLNKPVKAQQLTRLIQRLLIKAPPSVPESKPQLALPLDGRKTPTVFVVDDDAAVREATRDLLQENGYAVEVFADGEAFLRADRFQGCLLVDARMPGMTGLELIERLEANGHALPTIMITGSGDVPMAVEAMKAGAVDFIEKPVGHIDLLASIERALDQSGDAMKLSQSRDTALTCVASLTARQRQIMDLVLAGHPSKNIATDLGISQRTVDNHRAAIMKKTGSKSLPALIRLAIAAA
jgi:two-component system CheB/CheR fusion protein